MDEATREEVEALAVQRLATLDIQLDALGRAMREIVALHDTLPRDGSVDQQIENHFMVTGMQMATKAIGLLGQKMIKEAGSLDIDGQA